MIRIQIFDGYGGHHGRAFFFGKGSTLQNANAHSNGKNTTFSVSTDLLGGANKTIFYITMKPVFISDYN